MESELEVEVPFPFLPPKSTVRLMDHFDETYFRRDSDSHLYHLVDALAGDSGAGNLKKELLIKRLAASAETIYFEDLDRIFGVLFSVHRLDYESYEYNPYKDLLTSEQWDEIRVKDAWYRARAQEFLEACGYGGTVVGFKKMVHSLLGVDSDVYEIWKYLNNPTILGQLGRTEYEFPNEIVIAPHVDGLDEKSTQILLHFLDRIKPVDSIITIDPNGLAVHSVAETRSITSDSVYFEVQKTVTGVPDIANTPPPEYLWEDVFSGSDWLKPGTSAKQPQTAFNSTQEHSYVYTFGSSGQITTAEYFSESGSKRTTQKPYLVGDVVAAKRSTVNFPLSDSPDNFPGGRSGITPTKAPAKYADGTDYRFPYASQDEYNTAYVAGLRQQGFNVISWTRTQYVVELTPETLTQYPVAPQLALTNLEKVQSRDITTSWFTSRELIQSKGIMEGVVA